MTEQARKLTLTSRAFRSDRLGMFYKTLHDITGYEMVLPMNTGAEAVETAIKTARKWGYQVKQVEPDQAEIIVCNGNFHGRTTTIVGFSSEARYKEDFGPFTPGFVSIPTPKLWKQPLGPIPSPLWSNRFRGKAAWWCLRRVT